MKITNFKAGNIESIYSYDYEYFVPEKINHSFEIDNSKVNVKFETAARLIGELNAMARLVPNIDIFILSFIGNEATLSSKIEGTKTEIDDIFKTKEDIKLEDKDDLEEVMLYIQAVNSAIEGLDKTPISTRLIKQAHKTLLSSGRGKNKMPGEFRTTQNWLGPSLKNAEFIPAHQSLVNELMSDLEKFLHNQDILVPDLIKVAVAHYQFETIHPFCDGNGRIGRMLIPLYLVDKQLLSKPLLYMSVFFEKNKTLYCQKLMQVRQFNDLSGWLLFFLTGVEQTAKHSIKVLTNILNLKEKLTSKISSKTNRVTNNLKLLEKLFQEPFIRVKDVEIGLEVSSSVAKNIVDDLVRVEVLKELTGNKRNRIFVFSSYLELLKTPFPEYE